MRRVKNGRISVVPDQPGHVEDAGAFQEERALLREEERKARQVHLPEIGFGLGEVGIDGEGRVEAR